MRLQRMAVSSNISIATSWTSAFLYQILPVLMISSSSSFFQVPLIWTNFDLSWNNGASLSTFLSAIHCHFSLERLMISCSAGVGEVLGVDCAHNDCTAIIKKQSARTEYFIWNLFGLLNIVCSCSNDFIVSQFFSRLTIS